MKHKLYTSVVGPPFCLKCGPFDWLSSGVSLGTDLIKGAINQSYTRSNMAKQNQYNMAMQKDAQAYNTEMWNKTNEYNDPKNSRQRLVNAGLNPIAVGQMNGNTSVAASGGSGSTVGLPSVNAPNISVDPLIV